MRHIIVLLVSYFFICGTASAANYTYAPENVSELKDKLNGKLKAGDVVYLSDGVYTDFQVAFKGEGTQSMPITLKAQNEGKVILTGKLSLKISGNYLVVDGLVFKDGMANSGDIIEFRTSSKDLANNCRLTNTVIDNCNNPDEKYRETTDYSERWVMLYGKNNRVDHCYFTNKINGGVLMMVNINDESSRENNNIIDYNFFGQRPKFAPGNNAEMVRIGDSSTSQYSSKTIVENNYFYRCDGEVEIISVKSCDNILRKNVFYESAGGLVCRHGHRNTIESNAFIGNSKKNTAGVRVINQGHRIYNNFFQDLVGTGSYSALCVMTALFEAPNANTDLDKEPLNAYHRVKDVEICHNTFVNCQNIDLGTKTTYTYSSSNPYYPGQKVSGTLIPQCLIANNIVYNPTSSKVITQISGNVSDISYSNNIYTLSSSLSINGFEVRNINFEKTEDGYGEGIYVMKNATADLLKVYNSAGKVFSYVTKDISGDNRDNNKSIGAQQSSNVGAPFTIAKLSDVGAVWYESLQNDKSNISTKTDFWELIPNNIAGSSQITENDCINISNCDSQTFRISSTCPISFVSIFNISGQMVLQQKATGYSTDIDSNNLLSGVHLFCVEMLDGKRICQKVMV